MGMKVIRKTAEILIYISLGSLSELETLVLNIRGTGYGKIHRADA